MLTAIYYSYTHQKQECLKLKALEELCELFAYIHKNISCFSKPFGELCRGYTSPVLEQLQFYALWREGKTEEAVNTLSFLEKSVWNELYHYLENAGQGYKEEELQLCQYTKERMQEAMRKQKEDSTKKNKMYRTLPFLLVFSILLLFW